jgi:hypothetical protein
MVSLCFLTKEDVLWADPKDMDETQRFSGKTVAILAWSNT